MFLYKYSGPVKKFNLIVTHNWEGYTYAVSEAKARSNLTYQFKKQHGLTLNTKITLPGRIILEEQVTPEVDHQITMEEYLESMR